MALRLCLLASVLLLAGCESFESEECGGLHVHTYRGGLLGGYRYVVINDAPSLRFTSVDGIERYMDGDEPKVTFENENPLVISCGPTVSVVSDSRPATNTLGRRVAVEVVEPYELIDAEAEPGGFVVW